MGHIDIKDLANEIITPILQSAGFLGADVEAKKDHDGDESLYLTLHFAPGAEVASGKAYIDAQVAIQSALERIGDLRFPYFRYDYPDDPAPFDEDEAYGAQ